MADVTQILSQIESGNLAAAEQLLPLVYEELRKLASSRLAREQPGQTLSATALVHEAYLRLVDGEAKQWESRGHFFAAAAEAMRRILIDRARRRQRPKHGGDRRRVDLDSIFPANDDAAPDAILAMDEALAKLALEAPHKAELIRIRYFTGCSLADAAKAAGISYATAKRYWTYSRAWLCSELMD